MPAVTPDLLLLALVAAIAAQRVAELAYNRRTTRWLVGQGARAVRPDGMAWIVTVHALWFIGLVAEGAWAPWATQPSTRLAQVASAGAWDDAGGGLWLLAVGLSLWLLGNTLRAWSMWALGHRWSTRVWILPGQPLVRHGPYRFLPHPIYVGVALELAGLPMAFGLWGTLGVVALLNAGALANRIRIEGRALGLHKDGQSEG